MVSPPFQRSCALRRTCDNQGWRALSRLNEANKQMAIFNYKAVTPDGKVVEGSLDALNERDVLARLEENGQLPIKVSGSGGARGLFSREFELPWKRKRVRRKELLIFSQELATLVRAGLPLDRSLSVLGDLTENEFLREIVRESLREIKEGKALSDAFAGFPQVFPKVYVNMVKAGEIGGVLDQILVRLTEYLENAEELREYLISAMIYPIILSCVSLGSIVIMLTFVIPKFAAIFDNADMPMPLPMQIMLGVSGVATGYWWLIGGLILLGTISFRRWRATDSGKLAWDTRLMKLPLLGVVLQKLEVSRFSRTLGTLLKSAVPLIQSINIVKEIVSNRYIGDAMEPIKSGVKKGEGLTRPVRESGVFPSFAIHLLEVGEETGRLDDMLLQIADVYDRELRITTKRLMSFVEPAIILFMGLIIGTMVVSIIYSIFSINNTAI